MCYMAAQAISGRASSIMPQKILVIEDERRVADGVAYALKHERVDGALQQKISAGGSLLDSEWHEVVVDGHGVELSPKKFDLLAYLVSHVGQVRSRADILKAVWGDSEYVDARTIDVHVR